MKKTRELNRNPLLWIKDVITLAKPFWQSNKRYTAYVLLSLIIILRLSSIAMNVVINQWTNSFYNAIQNYDLHAFYIGIAQFTLYASVYISCFVIAYVLQKKLCVLWREWLTTYYMDKWLAYGAFYKSRFLAQINDNPDQRINDDVNSFIILTLELAIDMLDSFANLFSFVIILWGLSGIIHFTILGTSIHIYGYLVWVALIYAVIGTYIKFKIGKPLVRLDYQEQTYAASFRYNLVRVHENSESIAFYKGEPQEKRNLGQRLSAIVSNYKRMIYRQLRLDFIDVGYQQLAIIFPLIVIAPRYFSRLIKLGDIMQIKSAFSQVQGSLSYFIYSYTALAGLRATMDRLLEFLRAIEQTDNLTSIAINSGNYPLEVNNLTLTTPTAQVLAKNISFCLHSGDKLLLSGKTGCGKTTLLRTLAQLWPFAHGEIKQLNNCQTMFISQKTYLPIDSLLAIVSYPKHAQGQDIHTIIEILTQCQLDYLLPRLNEVADWSKILSLGEQQKIAFCRILLHKPDLVYCDEASASLDEETEDYLYGLLHRELPQLTLVSVAHRTSLTKWHNKFLNFNTLDSA